MINFDILEEELEKAIVADEKYQRENDAKFRAVEQKVATYDEFRDIVKASHLKPLEKTEKIVDPNLSQKNVIWNSVAKKNYEKSSPYNEWKKNKKHFTET
ncbi:conserved hypothetical protein [Pediculus humanus corporis]|uniref:Dynein attachment factor N-terminal domain-containing protein n=1 Tax=Pediculus humanus subsp. corporis TaxID=121224 RepID=E0VTX9_PEDHC|nr:uncharacterized protein Phum_PHUM440110 [Pediculus humanus corporis]EEB16835.1 conserved hypothetical protein [Pediculus humanus corporis]